jgi:hypothetical protein
MTKIAIIVLAGTETHEGLGRVVNALETAKEFHEQGDDVAVVFDGAGTQAAAALSDPEHRSHRVFASVRDTVHGACQFCSGAFGVRDKIEAANIPLLDEYEGHPSIRSLIVGEYVVLTF